MSSEEHTAPPRHLGHGRLALILSVVVAVSFLVATRVWWSFLFGLLLVLFLPYLFWAGFTELFAERFLRFFLVDRNHERFLPQILQERFLPRHFFRVAQSYPAHLWWRSFQPMFLIFFLSSITVPRLPPATPTLEAAEFGLIGIGYLLLLGPVIGIAWLYEDWGIRGYKPTQGIASPLGSTLVGYIAGFGALGTFARFVATISTNPAEIVGAILFLLLLFLPSCLWIANIFVGNHEPRMMSRLEKGDLAVKIPLKSFKIE